MTIPISFRKFIVISEENPLRKAQIKKRQQRNVLGIFFEGKATALMSGDHLVFYKNGERLTIIRNGDAVYFREPDSNLTPRFYLTGFMPGSTIHFSSVANLIAALHGFRIMFLTENRDCTIYKVEAP